MTRDEVLPAGVNHFPISGHYFELLSVVTTVDVRAFGKNGNVIADERGVSAGYYIDRRVGGVERFERLEIVTPGNDRTKFIITDGYSGTKAVPLDISNNAARLLGIVYGNLGQLAQLAIGGVNALQVTKRGHQYGVAYTSNALIAAGGTNQVFAPGSNVNGAIVWRADFTSASAAGQILALLAKTSAPTTVIDGDGLGVCQAAAGVVSQGKLEDPVFVAAGKGLFFFSLALETSPNRQVLYTLL